MPRSLLLLAVLCSSAAAAAPLPPELEQRITRAVEEELKEGEVPGAAVAVLQDGQLVYLKAFGVRSVDERTPVTPDTLFRLGSTTKMLTSLVALEAAAQGKVALDAPVGRYAKGLNPALGKVTLRQLLSHTAGMREASPSVQSKDDDALGRMVRSWKADYLFAPPGDVFSYSGPGYWLAGYALEGVHGKPYADLMRTQLFLPLGMARSTLRPLEALTWDFAQGHEEVEKRLSVVRPMAENVAMYPAGSAFSLARELARLAAVLLAGGRDGEQQLLAPAAVKDFFTPGPLLPGGEGAHYGFGLVSFDLLPSDSEELLTFEHGGVRRGYGSHLRFLPQRRGAVILLTNRNGATLPRSLDLITRAVWKTPETPEPAPAAQPLSAAEAKAYVGTYAHADLVRFDVRWDGQQLLLDKTPLERVGEHQFRTKEGAQYLFVVEKGARRAQYLHTDLLTAARTRGK